MLNNKARATANIWLPTPSFGPVSTTKYVIPKSGIRTNKAFDAFRYCFVSTVFAERSFVIRTCKENKLFYIRLSLIFYCLREMNNN